MKRIQSLLGIGPLWAFMVPAVAALAALVVHAGGLNQMLFLWLNQHLYWLGERFWSCATLFGDGLVIVALLGVMLRYRPQVAWAGLLAVPFGALLTHLPKYLLDSAARPPAVLPLDSFHVIGPMLRMGSFPSGHTIAIFVLAAVWAACSAQARWRWLALAVAALVGLSRIAVGVHWPVDVLAGAAAGWIAGLLGVAWARRWDYGVRANGLFMPLFLLVCALALFFHDPKYDLARTLCYAVAAFATAFVTWELWRRLVARRTPAA